MKRISFLFCMVCFLFLAGCMQKKERLALVDSYNEAVTLYGEVLRCMVLETNIVDEDTVLVVQKIGQKLKELRTEIATNSMTEKRMNEINKWLSDCKKWSREAICVWGEEQREGAGI